MLTDLVMLSGATGLIGAKVGQLLVQAGFRVVTVSRSAKNASLMCPFPAAHIGWDEISKFDLKSVSHVIHLAGEPVANWPWSAKRKKLIVSSRVDATHDFIEHFKHQNASPKSWTNASAIGFYGDRSETILNETTARGVGFLSDTCDLWEKVTDHPHLSKTRVTKFRIGVVLSNRSGALNQMLPIFRAGLGGRLGSGKQWMSWVDIDDVARMFVFALTNESVSGVYNAVSPTPVTNGEFTKTCWRFF